MKTVIFIDGENLRYGLKPMGLEEEDINWARFFQACLDDGDDFIRTYWYQAAHTSDPHIGPERARNFLAKTRGTAGIDEEQVQSTMARARQWKNERNEQYKGKLRSFDNLSIRYSQIEMVRAGVLKMDPFLEKYNGEKGIDVALAIDMVKVQEHCDKIILVSGDMDYAAAIKFVKDRMKRVHIVRLVRGSPPKNTSVSRKLRELADKVVDIHESDIKSKMRAFV